MYMYVRTLTLYAVVIQGFGHGGQCLIPRVSIGNQLRGEQTMTLDEYYCKSGTVVCEEIFVFKRLPYELMAMEIFEHMAQSHQLAS